jgi:hypothetical protein
MAAFQSFTGVITLIDDFWGINGRKSGCIKLMSVVNKAGRLVNFVVMPNTYFVDHAMVNEGDTVTGISLLFTALPPEAYRLKPRPIKLLLCVQTSSSPLLFQSKGYFLRLHI